MEAREHAGIRDEEHNLARLLHNALKEADACAGYAVEAEAAGDGRLAGFFRDVQHSYASVAERAEKLLEASSEAGSSTESEGRVPSGVRPGDALVEGDPGDVSPGQDVEEVAVVAEAPPRPVS